MGLRINLNESAQTAHRMLAGTDKSLQKSMERLSSGFRINSAGDDPAGLVISEKLRAQVSGLSRAIRNAGDAVNMIRTAEGALQEVNNILQSMRDLAVHAANTGANDAASVAADQAQINSAIQTLNEIAAETQFGQKALLDGSAGVRATLLGTAVAAANLNYSGLESDTLIDINVTSAAEQASMASKDFGSDAVVNAGGGSLEINGVTITYEGTTTASELAGLINNAADQTGVIAQWNAVTNQIELSSSAYGSSARIDITSGADFLTGGAGSAAAIGSDVAATVLDADGEAVGGTWTGNGLVLSDDLGNSITFTQAGGTTVQNNLEELSATVGTLTFQVGAYAGQTRTLSIASIGAQYLATTVYSGENISTLDVETSAGAQQAIEIIDAAITQISSLRADLGAFQTNVLESTINSLTIAKENIAASESTIRDTDMAAEVVEFTKNQILQQAGTAMLAQANQSPEALLSLLR